MIWKCSLIVWKWNVTNLCHILYISNSGQVTLIYRSLQIPGTGGGVKLFCLCERHCLEGNYEGRGYATRL